MKLSFITTSTFVLLCGNVATATLTQIKDSKATSDIDIVSSITKIALPDAFQRHLQISYHTNLILKKRRQLQTAEPTSACDQAYTDIYLNNAALVEAQDTYLNNYATTHESLDAAASCIVSEDTLTVDCDFSQSTILGHQEFESACTNLGAQVIVVSLDTTCDMNLDGTSISLGMQFTEFIDCIPAECEEEFQTAIEEIVTASENEWESTLLANGATNVECAGVL